MVNEKKCNGKDMDCERVNGCQLEEKVNPEYQWPRKIEKKGVKCSFYRRIIEAENEDENIFTFEKQKCRIKDGVCILKEQTTIWNKEEMINKCPHEIKTDQFLVIGQNILRNTKKKNFEEHLIVD